MDLLTHMAAGAAAGTTIAVCAKGKTFRKAAMVCAGALGGALPDVDAISLWSRFDATFGRLFGLSHSGREIYSDKFWYSHHAFMHSLAACLLFTFLLLVVVYLVRKRCKRLSSKDFISFTAKIKASTAAFAAGYVLHLVCDMPTPASSWGGVNLLFPLKTYTGGWGKIWWWNNYDLFLIITGVIIANLLILVFSKVLKSKGKYLSCAILTAAIIAIAVQINGRGFDYNSHPYPQCEAQSKEIQKEILGKKLYDKMKKVDNCIPIHF